MQLTFVALTDCSAATVAARAYATRLATLAGAKVVLHADEAQLVGQPAAHLTGPASGHSLRARLVASHAAGPAELARDTQALSIAAEPGAKALLGPALHHLLAHCYPQLLVLGRAHTHAWLAYVHQHPHQGLIQLAVLQVPANWHRRVLPRRAVVAADGQPLCLAARAHALAPLLAGLHLATTVVHVAAHAHGPSRAAEALDAVRNTGLFGPLNDGNSVYELREMAPAEGVLRAVAELGADLLVVVAHPHGFPGSLFHHDVTAELLRTSPVPVLVLPGAAR